MSDMTQIEGQLNQAIADSGHVFLIDEPSIAGEMAGFTTLYRRFCESTEGIFLEFKGSNISEKTLLKHLNGVAGRSASKADSDRAHHTSLQSFLDAHPQGLISIQAGHSLSGQTTEVVAGLVDYARREKLSWKIFIVADTLLLDDALVARFGVDHSITDMPLTTKTSRTANSVPTKKRRHSKKTRSKRRVTSEMQERIREGLSSSSAKVLAAALSLAVVLVFYLKAL